MKEFLYINNVSFSYPDAIEPLFEDITLQCQPGWTGLVGPNGRVTVGQQLHLLRVDPLPHCLCAGPDRPGSDRRRSGESALPAA